MTKVKILVIEDNRVLRDGITTILNKESEMHVVATIASGNNILRKAKDTKPHIVLLDVGFTNLNELSVVALIKKNLPEVKVIGMGFIPTQSDIVEFIEAGASGFILKDATVKEFIETIRSVARGEKIIPPIMTASLFSHIVADMVGQKKKMSIKNAVRMTNREREIIILIGEGLSNKEIAGKLNIATFTVKSHIHNILEKLALHGRLEIARYADVTK